MMTLSSCLNYFYNNIQLYPAIFPQARFGWPTAPITAVVGWRSTMTGAGGPSAMIGGAPPMLRKIFPVPYRPLGFCCVRHILVVPGKYFCLSLCKFPGELNYFAVQGKPLSYEHSYYSHWKELCLQWRPKSFLVSFW